MTLNQAGFEGLNSDEVFVEGMVADDVKSLWRRLVRTGAVREVARSLGSDPSRIRALCEFVQGLLVKQHDGTYRHPHDIAICAGLVVLEQSPLSHVRRLITLLRRSKQPSQVWVQRMAEYCDERFAGTTPGRVPVGGHDEDEFPPLSCTGAGDNSGSTGFPMPSGAPTLTVYNDTRSTAQVA